LEKLLQELKEINVKTSPVISKLANKYYKYAPVDNDDFIELCNDLVLREDWVLFIIVTIWIKKRKTVYGIKYFPYYHKWLLEYIDSWGRCDIFCYRCLNPVIEQNPELFKYVQMWAESPKVYVRRASAVCLLNSHGTFSVNCSFDKIELIVNKLINDKHIHIQKGIGWLLKYTYLSYPKQTISYLKDNLDKMSRTTFRYGLEKMPKQLRKEMLNLS